MTINRDKYAEVKARVAKLPKLIGDPEKLHLERDAIMIDVLRWIAVQNNSYVAPWAKLALEAYDMAGGDLWFS